MKIIFGIILLQAVVQIKGQGIGSDFCQGKEAGAYPHPDPENCSSFVICAVGLPFPQQCPPNEIFVPEIGSSPPFGVCEPGYPETCQLATPEPTTLGTTTSTYAPPTNETTTTSGPEIPREICHGILFRRIPHPDNCYQYYFCIAQVPHLGQCLSHQIFHPDWNICIRGNRDTCSFGLPADICDGTETVQFLPHPDDCAKYVLCLMGVGTEVDCPTNQIFDEVNGRCEPGDPITCELFTTTPPTTTTTTTFTDEPTTTTTTEEITTTTTTEPTTTTTVTDEPTTTTTTEEITTTTTTFTEEPTTTTPIDDTTTTTTIPDIPTTTTTTQSTTTTSTEPGPEITTPSTTTTQRPIGPPELCTGNNFRFIPDPDYCYRFYYCMFGIALPGTCDPDRIFSERWRGCVFGNWETCEADNPITIVTSISSWN